MKRRRLVRAPKSSRAKPDPEWMLKFHLSKILAATERTRRGKMRAMAMAGACVALMGAPDFKQKQQTLGRALATAYLNWLDATR